MKINHLSIFRMLALLALIFATLYGGANFLYAQKTEYYSGDVVIDANGVPIETPGDPDAKESVHDLIIYREVTQTRAIMAYSHTEFGENPRVISKFGFYIDSLTTTLSSVQTGITVLYRFTEYDITPLDIRVRVTPNWGGPEWHINTGWNCEGQNPLITENDVANWLDKGYTQVFSGDIDWSNYADGSSGQWIEFELPEAFNYTGKENLHIVVVCNSDNYGYANTIASPYFSYYNNARTWPDNVNDGCACLYADEDNYYAGYIYDWGWPVKPVLKLVTYSPITIEKATPGSYTEANISYRLGTVLESNEDYLPSERPSFTVDMSSIEEEDADLPTDVSYRIVGPSPSTNTVYYLNVPSPGTANVNYVTVTKNEYASSNYVCKLDVPRAAGPMAWTTGQGADFRSLDLRDVLPGEYKVIVNAYTHKYPQTPQFQDTVINNFNESVFHVRTDNDIEVSSILQPTHLSLHPILSSRGTIINVPVTNSGFRDITEFWAQIYLHKVEYNEATGQVIVQPVTDTLPKVGGRATYQHFIVPLSEPFSTGRTVILNQTHFSGGFQNLQTGWYAVEVKVFLDDPDNTTGELLESSAHTFNNVYPRSGTYHLIHAQAFHDPWLTRHTNFNQPADYITGEPIPNYEPTTTSLGRHVNINIGLINDGLLDMSNTSGVILRTDIYKLAANGTYEQLVFTTIDTASRGGVGEGEVTIYCREAWYVSETGQFDVVTTLQYPGAPAGWSSKDSVITSRLIVREGLIGNYTIGTANAGRANNFVKINDALEALYNYGITGDCLFELTDKVYDESPIRSNRFDDPALDFRSKIAGAYEIKRNSNGKDSLYINTIRFAPSSERMTESGSVKINLTSRSGIGMWFGATEDSVVYTNAMVNVSDMTNKRLWHQNDGYITWDGGTKKSFEITYKMPNTVERMPGERFRVPIYMTNAKNITITNCIITDGNTEPSWHYQLPGSTYIGPVMYWSADYDFNTADPTNKSTYSSGIILRSRPAIQPFYNENRLRYDTLPCHNITISNNDISKFAYGIVNIGINYRMANTPFVIDIIDTLYNMARNDLDRDFNLEFDTAHIVIEPNGDTTMLTFYRHKTIGDNRFNRYYKLFEYADNSHYVVILDSAAGGVRRVFNHDNIFENNLIHEVGRAGIFVGNDENSVISGNRIHGISGQVYNESGALATKVDCAGIMLGGAPRISAEMTRGYDAFMLLGTLIFNNEISNVTSNMSASGIKFEQNVLNENISITQTSFPDRTERMKIYGNIIWGISVNNSDANRYGINLSISKPINATSLFATVNDAYYMNDILVANNTIILDEDNIAGSRGDYYGLYLQKIKNSRVLNNAIEMEDTTHVYFHTQRDFAAASVFYQGPSPAEALNTINYNIYSFKATGNSDVSAYRYVNTDNVSGIILDKGYADEYQSLRNWQNWMKDDMFSTTASFASDLVKTQSVNDKFEKIRLRTNPVVSNSPLDKRGTYVAEATTDIDGLNRIVANQVFDIGAQIVNGTRNAVDVEVVNIVAPATYQAMRGPFMDAEYFMIADEPITVRVLIRNNGGSAVQNKKISLRVLQESEMINNKNAKIHTDNYTITYNNDEANHNTDVSTFEAINPNAQITYYPLWDTTKTISVPMSGGIYVDFTLSKTFNTYIHLPGYDVPIQFSRMTPNVTPRYLFVVTVDNENDMEHGNNVVEKYARFYVKKSKRDMLISASNAFNTINLNNKPMETVTNPDMVAGRLNLDSLIVGFRKLNLHQSDAEAREFDFDVIDRKAWDFRNIDYTLYKTIYISDELKIDTLRWFGAAHYDNTYRYFRDRWLVQNITDFLNESTYQNKRNLIIGSEEHISDIYSAINDSQFSFLQANNTIKQNLIDTFYRTNTVYDTLWHDSDTDPNQGADLPPTIYGYSPRVPLAERIRETIPPNRVVYYFEQHPYKFAGDTVATITGVNLFEGFKFEIKSTPWKHSLLTDAPPIGTIIKPIESVIGRQNIGAVVDTMTMNGKPISDKISDIPLNKRIVSLCQNTMNTNIVFMGFDWRHFGNLDMLLTAIDEHIRTNGGYDGGTSLPISFYGFEAQPINNRVELTWNTASETIIQHFELERAEIIDNNIGSFKFIESIKAQDNSHDNSYGTTDRNLNFGSTLAYRLKLINTDGSFSYSNNKVVKIEDALFSVSSITPNPITSTATFNVTLQADQNINITIYDMSGKEVLVLNNGVLGAGNLNFEINNSDITAGVYTLSISSDSQTITKQFTIVK